MHICFLVIVTEVSTPPFMVQYQISNALTYTELTEVRTCIVCIYTLCITIIIYWNYIVFAVSTVQQHTISAFIGK